MTFFSSVLSRLTDPTGQNVRDTGADTKPDNLTCRDEVDDFMLVSQNDDSSQRMNAAQMLPPSYQEVTQADIDSAGRPNSVSLATSLEDVKTSPLDGVPFSLWYGHTAAVQSALLARCTDSAFGQRCTPEDILNRYNYTFDTERSVLREFGDMTNDFYLGTPYMADTENGDPHSQAFSDMTSDFEHSSPHSAVHNRSFPEVGCLVDLS